MEKDNKKWLPIVILLGAVIVVFLIGGIVTRVLAGADEVASKGKGEIKSASYDDDDEEANATFSYDDYESDPGVTVTVLSAMENPSKYIIGGTSYQGRYSQYTDEDMVGLSDQEIYYALMDIYAYHGCGFDSTEVQEYYDGKTWYTNYYQWYVDEATDWPDSADYYLEYAEEYTIDSMNSELSESNYSYDKQEWANIEFLEQYMANNNITYTPAQ